MPLADTVATFREAKARLRAERDAASTALIEARDRAGRAEGEAAALREAVAREARRADHKAAERREAEAALAGWTAGGPLARAWRAFLRGR